MYRVARYLAGRKLRGDKRYPLVLMLEPLFQCNLACAGCGKIDYPKEILQKSVSVEDALRAVDECGAPMVSIPGGEPLIHKEMPQIVAGIVARKKFVYLCTNAILLAKHIDEYQPSPYLTFSIHLDGNRERHDESVCQEGVFDKAVAAIKLARDKGFRVTINCTLFNGEDPADVAEFFDTAMQLGVEGITVSPGYSYHHAPRQDVFLGRNASKQLFREIFSRRRRPSGKAPWSFNHSALFLDFLAGNQTYQCTPWSNPTYNIFGWQRPCYLLVRRRLCADLPVADRGHRVGEVRRRQESALRQLHGALRLRGHRGQRRLQPSDQGADEPRCAVRASPARWRPSCPSSTATAVRATLRSPRSP